MKVGIDLSSTNTGLVILSDDNKLVFHGNFQLWDGEYTHKVVPIFVANIIQQIYLHATNKANNIYIGVELADFKNANITNRFNMIFGAIYQELWNTQFHFPDNIKVYFNLNLADVCYNALKERCPIKVFNSNEWQRFLLDIYKPYIQHYTKQNKKIIYRVDKCGDYVGIYKHTTLMVDTTSDWLDKRGLLKLLSRMWAHKNCKEYDYEWTEDECDAYCIAYFLEKLRDRTQMHQEVKVRNKAKAKSEKQALRDKLSKEKRINKLNKIVIKYKSIEKLTKAQQRALEKAEMELKEYENNN